MVVAHLTDLHLLERRERHGVAARFVSLGRRLDAEERIAKVTHAIEDARARGATHFVFTGDLTETGTLAQFEVLAEVIASSGLRPWDVTLVPGNHDRYDAPESWQAALDGPLRPYASNAAREPGKAVALDGGWLLPIDATFHQPVTRSAGRFDEEVERALLSRLNDPAFADVPVLVAVHHPPHPRPGPWHWVDGLLGGKRLLSMVEQRANVTILHGHLHKPVLRTHGLARVVGSAAVVDGASAGYLSLPNSFSGGMRGSTESPPTHAA